MNTSSSRAVLAGLLAVVLLIVGMSIYLLFAIYFSKSGESLFPQLSQADTGEHRNASSTMNEAKVTSTVLKNETASLVNVNTSEWTKYENADLRFEVKLPKEWKISSSDSKRESYVKWGNGNSDFRVMVIHSSSTTKEVEDSLGINTEDSESFEISGVKGYIKNAPLGIRKLTLDPGLTYADEIFLKNGNNYYLLNFTIYADLDHADIANAEIVNWKLVLQNFRVF